MTPCEVETKLSSRHPVFDLCDMYAKADMYGLGAGIFPKDKVPTLPVHPHCLCRIVEIYRGELKGKEKERIREAGDEWLKKLNKVQRERVLGIEGENAWQKGGDWREYARGWAGLRTAKSRLPSDALSATIEGKNPFGFNEIQGDHSRKEDLIAVNPNYSTRSREWRVNCQRCVSTYEARIRGMDVTAKPAILNGTDRLPYMFDLKNGWTSVYQNPTLVQVVSNSAANLEKKVRATMASWGDGARAIVRVQWKGQHSGHVFIAEQAGGKTVFVDPQAATEGVEWYFQYCKIKETYLIRIDNLDFTDKLKECCENVR